MALPPPTAPASVPLAWPSRLSACLAALTTPAILSHQGSYCLMTSSQSPSTILLPCSCPPPPVGGSTTPPTSLKQPSEHSPCRSVTFRSMGGEWHSPHHFVTFASMGGECTPLAGCPQPPTGATPHGCQGTIAPLPVTTGAARPSPSLACPFLPTQSSPSHLPTMGGSAALVACCAHAHGQGRQSLAYYMYSMQHAEAHPWVVDALNAVTLKLQNWYQRHSICCYLAQHTWHPLTATTIQCWKRRIWLDCWFSQQALHCQKHLRLKLFCCGALAYAVLVWGNR
jgi:hypothetical protein